MATYFVSHLSDRVRDEKKLREHGRCFEIQLLDKKGRALASKCIGPNDRRLEIDGRVIPTAVLDAARRQPIGQGDYVNDDGLSIQPF